MFSFFKTKKPSPPSSPESDPIPSASSDFEIVNPAPGGPGPSRPNTAPYPPYPTNPLYPTFDASGMPIMYPPALPTRPVLQHSDSMQATNQPLNGVPFKLSPKLSIEKPNEILKIQVDDILASLIARMQIMQLDYDFKLERSILEQGQDDVDSARSEAEEDEQPADD